MLKSDDCRYGFYRNIGELMMHLNIDAISIKRINSELIADAKNITIVAVDILTNWKMRMAENATLEALQDILRNCGLHELARILGEKFT